MTLSDFRKLCTNYLTENLSDEEIKLFNESIENSEEFKNEFETMNKVWNYSAASTTAPEVNIDTNWTKIETNLDLSNSQSIQEKSFQFVESFWKPATAILAIALVMFITFYSGDKTPIFVNKTVTVSTQNGEQKNIILSDGSMVSLNSGSSVEYPEKFEGNIREIMLRGEAFFKVTKGTKPFVVSTFNANTTVLGTEFNVKARESKTEVIVREGLVNLAPKNGLNKNVNIAHDQFSRVTDENDASDPKQVDAKKLLGWLEGKLVFEQTPLSEIIKELERFYDVKVTLGSEDLNNISITGSFMKKDIDTTLTMLCLTLNLDYDQLDKDYIIKQK